MKLLRRTGDKMVFQVDLRESVLLQQTLKLYPRVPPAHQPLSNSGKLPDPQENQRLLDDALAEHRAANKKQVQAFVTDPRRFKPIEDGFRLSLTRPDAEWLLQVLNDVRVGSWLILGSPEERLKAPTAKTAPDFWAMEIAGYFQEQLLESLMGDGT